MSRAHALTHAPPFHTRVLDPARQNFSTQKKNIYYTFFTDCNTHTSTRTHPNYIKKKKETTHCPGISPHRRGAYVPRRNQMLRLIQLNGFRQHTSYDVIKCSGSYSLMAEASSPFVDSEERPDRPLLRVQVSSSPDDGLRNPERQPARPWRGGEGSGALLPSPRRYPEIRDAGRPSGTTTPARHMDRPSLPDSGEGSERWQKRTIIRRR